MSKGEKSIWDLAVEQANEAEAEDSKGEEKSVFVVGSKNAGKTSMILRFQERDEAPKPTTALEYTFARRARGHNMAKDVGHIWELGGGTWLSKLIEIPINIDSICNTAIALVLDLSKPNELWFTLEKLLEATKAQMDLVLRDLSADDPEIRKKLRAAAITRIGEGHPDRELMDPFPVPLVIIGSKFDLYQDFDSEKRKIISRTLRFVSLVYGAHLQFFSTKHEALVKRARNLISHLLFNTEITKRAEVDHNKPLLVPCGTDTSEEIGAPPIAEGDVGRITARHPLELWKLAYTGHFPQENTSDPALVEDPAKDKQYAEAAVDAMRAQKDEELERYRRMSERRMREAAQRAMAEGYA